MVRTSLAASALVLALLPVFSAPVSAEADSGSYLAGRSAIYASDFAAAARYYTAALARDPDDPQLLEAVVLAQLALGRVPSALPVARRLESRGLRSHGAHMVTLAGLVAEGAYDAIIERDDTGETGIGPLVDGLVGGWARLGNGSVSDALAQFDRVADESGFAVFALYHKAMALASVGDFEGAAAIYESDEGRSLSRLSRRAVTAYAEILSQLDRNDDAMAQLVDAFGTGFDPAIAALADQLDDGVAVPFSHVRSVRDGMAEVFFSVAQALRGDVSDDYVLIFTRIASYLRPDHIDALLLSAELLDALEQYDLAVDTYRRVPQDSADHQAAELGRAEALRRSDRPDAAREVLERLAEDDPLQSSVHSALGDLLRQQEDYAAAVAAYDDALANASEGDRSRWFLHYARGISHERLDQWPEAEADFRAALELNPEQPQVLNYLGYSLVEKQIKLDEALDMIERAVAARPDSGYIVDSLGWVLYRLGRYDEAVGNMERAVELMPVDPVVNDHLGDVYWAVGRQREAEFQWKRALSFIDPDDTDGEADPERIRRKLDVGLDKVLAEEGAPPLTVANDDG